tara:strand:+ start:571 stop:1173 length:603 start_codon:yes stop_codon:yes gene_type:complete
MKITKNQLKRIIKEEYTNTLAETDQRFADKVKVRTGDLLNSANKEWFEVIARTHMKNRPRSGDVTALHILNAMVRSVDPRQGEGHRGGLNNFTDYFRQGAKGGEDIVKVSYDYNDKTLSKLARGLSNQGTVHGFDGGAGLDPKTDFDKFIERDEYVPTKRADGSPLDGEDLKENLPRKVGFIEQMVRKELENRVKRGYKP